ncbi:MAG: PQQ-dependent dehydrogenase, methanol/ethanol family [Acidobacteria bacterium]|nr:PQQ-dependent dehydrogenase, methanol/ethanol family [Acidobacteriota bacterium]
MTNSMRTQRFRRTLCLGLLAALCAVAALGAQGGGVTYEQIVRAGDDPANWITYHGQYHAQRYSRLAQIDRSNVGRLELAWVRQLPVLGQVQTTPLVKDGIMYLTTPENEVYALDAATGNVFWTYQHDLSDTLALCCSKQSRGVGMLGERLYLTTMDAHLIALDAATGTELWDRKIADHLAGYSMTAAPLVVKDMIITGTGGGEYGIRGWVDAYDAGTGERRWRAYTIPGPGEPGNETWEGDSWKTGGASTWMTGSYDPDLNLIYWGVGNPGPDWNGEAREGDNLYSDSVIAIDADSGEIKWHFQFTPHDVHDWDACQVPVLVDMEVGGRTQKLMLFANRNGFFYVLDRETGRFVQGWEFAVQTWAQGLDDSGRPIRVPDMEPTPEGKLVFPDVNGASNWWSPSYSPDTGLFYTMAYDGSAMYYQAESEYVPGQLFIGGSHTPQTSRNDRVSAVRAIDPQTARVVWEHRVQPKSMSGVMTTAGGLAFAGTVTGNFIALDAETGADLWHRRLGGNVIAAPITYQVNGRQQVTIAAGQAIFTFALGD